MKFPQDLKKCRKPQFEKLYLTDLEGNLMLQNVIQLSKESSLIKYPLRYHLKFFPNLLSNIDINKPLYCFTLPGLILGTIGLYMSLSSVQDLYLDGSFNLENAILTILLTLVGIIMAYMGALLHLIAGLIRYKANKY